MGMEIRYDSAKLDRVCKDQELGLREESVCRAVEMPRDYCSGQYWHHTFVEFHEIQNTHM